MKDTDKCIESVVYEKNVDVVISDNDPSQSYKPPEKIRQLVRVVKTGGIAGFSEGNNIAVDFFLTKDHFSILILNNDTIVTKDALVFLRSTLVSGNVGAVGPCMPYLDNPKKVWACGGYINKYTLAIGGLQPKSDLPYEVDYLPGAAILCRADLWQKIYGFNKAYFLTYEEAEFCLEIKKQGFEVKADPRSVILHKVGMSSQTKPEYLYNNIRSRIIFSQYLYGKKVGFLYGLVITLAPLRRQGIKAQFIKIKLWSRAVSDHISGLRINRELLNSVAYLFRG